MNYIEKRLMTVGIASAALISTTILLNQTSVDAASATANSGYGQVELWHNINGTKTRDSNTLKSGSSWGIGGRINGSDGHQYYQVGNNEYASVDQMDTTTENSKQQLIGDVKTGYGNGTFITLYSSPLDGAQVVQNRGLGKYTEWYTDQRVIVNGQVYYRVATNEWVKGSDSHLISEKTRGSKTFLSDSDVEKPYLDIPYTGKNSTGDDTYTVLLKSNGEYLFNLISPRDSLPNVNMQKGNYSVNPNGSINFNNVTSAVFADWGNSEDMMNTAPGHLYFTGQGSGKKVSSSNLAKGMYFKVANDGSEITDGFMHLKPQKGLDIKDPEQVGPELTAKKEAANNY